MPRPVPTAAVLPVLGRAHLAVGLVGVAAFLASGWYMDRSLAHLVGMDDAPRALYRSGHIYILFASLLHLVLGAYVSPRASRVGQFMQYAGSLTLLAALVLFVYGFVVETPLGLIERPMTRVAIELALAGTLVHVLSSALFSARVSGVRSGPLLSMSRSRQPSVPGDEEEGYHVRRNADS